jgi:anaerobic selenocysteine-containing dehydrogenase
VARADRVAGARSWPGAFPSTSSRTIRRRACTASSTWAVQPVDQGASGREPIRLTQPIAAARGIQSGDMVRVFNDRVAAVSPAPW